MFAKNGELQLLLIFVFPYQHVTADWTHPQVQNSNMSPKVAVYLRKSSQFWRTTNLEVAKNGD